MGDYGIKIAKPGFDITTTGIENQVFNSAYPVLKVRETGNGVIVLERDNFFGTSIILSTHNLGYKPKVRVMCQWYDIDSGTAQSTYREAPFGDTLVGGSIFFLCNVTVQTDTIILDVATYTGDGTAYYNLNYSYIVYYDEET
jgi:hypothetical protein